ncbi:MAG: damage-inducible protein [Prevotellaceae bacterium]|jgi:DNA-damage-inducible protein D|nr:damage-inducible protein [Prevotellaceae bacterium]
MDDLLLQQFTGDDFEEYGKENGFVFWMASDLMRLLDYKSMTTFGKAINKAMTTCNTLNIPIMENFEQTCVVIDGRQMPDYKLSRLACYLTVMNADNKIHKVAQAQAYFATLAGAVDQYWMEANKVERLIVREEISDRESSLSGVAKRAGVENYAFFQSAGYRGLYNMTIAKLRKIRNIPDGKSPLDFMGRDELAANLFRITQTELKIKNEGITGQARLEVTAENVGRQVRKTMLEISNVTPEDLPVERDLRDVKAVV